MLMELQRYTWFAPIQNRYDITIALNKNIINEEKWGLVGWRGVKSSKFRIKLFDPDLDVQ
jgi:hypothetical protein